METRNTRLSSRPIPLQQDLFLKILIRELAGTLEDVVGYKEASGYISLVGQRMGEWLNELYKKELKVERLTGEQVIEVLTDLKNRIGGDFSVVEKNEDKVFLKNNTCPFEDKVIDRPSICMMTSNVFGTIVAQNLGYAKVVLEETIAEHANNCSVIVYLRFTPESEEAEGREYFGPDEQLLT
ncbi:MAG TPA: transcriptional regulator [Nitrospirae bacterium]|nr:transcriptional regulator [Nitrospirota bacterium]